MLTFLGEHYQEEEEELAGASVAPHMLPLESTCDPQQLLRPALQPRQGRQKGSFHETTLISNTRLGSPWMPVQDVRQSERECSQKWWRWQLDMWSSMRVVGKYGQDTDVYPCQTSQWSHQWKTKNLKLSLWFKDKNEYVVENTLEVPCKIVWFLWEDELTCSLKILVRMKVVSICKMLFLLPSSTEPTWIQIQMSPCMHCAWSVIGQDGRH